MSDSDEDDDPRVVLDSGSGYIRAGFAGDDTPRVLSPAHHLVYSGTRIGGEKRRAEPYLCSLADLFDPQMAFSSIHYPMQHGVVTDWDTMVMLWEYALCKELRVSPASQPLLLNDAPLSPLANREKMIEAVMEGLGVPATFIANEAELAVYASGRGCALALTSGAGVTHTGIIYEGYRIPEATQRVDYGGHDITKLLAQRLQGHGYSFTTSRDLALVNRMKDYCDYVADDYDQELKTPTRCTTYELPDGQSIELGSEAFTAPECLFNPKLFGLSIPSLPELVMNTLGAIEHDMRRHLYMNIVLSGGNTRFHGLPERLEKELRKLIPSSQRVKVIAPQERMLSVWMGGSILASLSTFQSQWITRAEYDEYGPSVIRRVNLRFNICS